jgi:hypothetical protein
MEKEKIENANIKRQYCDLDCNADVCSTYSRTQKIHKIKLKLGLTKKYESAIFTYEDISTPI